jgi:hypothetical protein
MDPSSPTPQSIGLTSLARLAGDTGGRYTERTNDITLAYARAHRDLACVYSVGFYIEDPEEDLVSNIAVNLKRSGARALHPSKYTFRSRSAQRESLIRAAFVSPEDFETGVVRAHIFPLRPTSKKFWDGLLAVGFPVPLRAMGGERIEREFGAVLSKGPVVVHQFNRKIRLRPQQGAGISEPLLIFLEPVNLASGRYELTAVMSDPRRNRPQTAKVEMVVPQVRKGEPFIVGPMLGREAGSNIMVMSQGTHPDDDEVRGGGSFEPLFVQHIREPVDLLALTQVCQVGAHGGSKKGAKPSAAIARSLSLMDGTPAGGLPDIELMLEGGGKVRCQNLVDLLPVSSVKNGEYQFEVSLETGDGQEGSRRKALFSISVPERFP